jgi:hypothetical protein
LDHVEPADLNPRLRSQDLQNLDPVSRAILLSADLHGNLVFEPFGQKALRLHGVLRGIAPGLSFQVGDPGLQDPDALLVLLLLYLELILSSVIFWRRSSACCGSGLSVARPPDATTVVPIAVSAKPMIRAAAAVLIFLSHITCNTPSAKASTLMPTIPLAEAVAAKEVASRIVNFTRGCLLCQRCG